MRPPTANGRRSGCQPRPSGRKRPEAVWIDKCFLGATRECGCGRSRRDRNPPPPANMPMRIIHPDPCPSAYTLRMVMGFTAWPVTCGNGLMIGTLGVTTVLALAKTRKDRKPERIGLVG